jgi:hypothetical protein
MKQPRERYVRERFAARMGNDLPQFRPSQFGGGFDDYACYRWDDGSLNFYATLRIDPVDDKFSIVITWMLNSTVPFFANTGVPDGIPNEGGLSVDLSLFLGHHAASWKVKYSPDPDKVIAWLARHEDAKNAASDPEKLKAFYNVDQAVDAIIDHALPYFSGVAAKYGKFPESHSS